MAVVIAMAGAGSRFRDVGYKVPKYKIQARGKSLFDWSMQSLKAFFAERFVFAVLQGDETSWIEARARSLGISNLIIRERKSLSRGQAETVADVLEVLDSNEPLWIYNIDTFVEEGLIPGDLDGYAGCVPVFESTDPGMSYVAYDDMGRVNDIAEKTLISRWGTVGLYGFARVQQYADVYAATYPDTIACNGERYVAPLYRTLLERGMKIVAPRLRASYVHVLGTPSDLVTFDSTCRPPDGVTAIKNGHV